MRAYCTQHNPSAARLGGAGAGYLQVVLVTPRAVRAHAKKDLSKDYGVQAPGSQG